MKLNKTLIAVVGPTAIGKTSLAIQLAQHYETEILSADSRQFYQEMTIGTAVPSKAELEQAKHHFIQHKSIHQPYTVGHFEQEAVQKLQELFTKNNYVILVGGSGLYIDAICKGLHKFPPVPLEVRKSLAQQLKTNGLKELQNQLKQLDPVWHAKVDLNNPHRVIRALEICLSSGKAYSNFIKEELPPRNFHVKYIGITAARETVYQRINQRVEVMLKNGLESEARQLYPYKKVNALQTVGYQELFKYFDQLYDLKTAIEEIKKNTRRFAKRQLTWYRKNPAIQWVDKNQNLESIINLL